MQQPGNNESRRYLSGAPPLSVELAVIAGVALTVLCLRVAEPWLKAHAAARPDVQTFALRDCPTPDALARRLIYLHRRGADVTAECGPVVGAPGARKGAR